MSDANRLLPVVHDHIHFDTLFAHAMQTITTYAGKTWTDTGEHDPGVTFMEAMSYGVSDLAYRHTLPLTDLLTPPVASRSEEDGIFPADFGPQTALTTSPITQDDYRRAILDLYDIEGGCFHFRNAQLCRRKKGSGYTYTYDIATRCFSFITPPATDGGDAIKEFELCGDYVLYVEPTEDASAAAKSALHRFLADHRNLGESVDEVIWATPQTIDPQIDIELEDAAQDFARIFAEIYQVTKAYISPVAGRHTAAELAMQQKSVEEIYKGPALNRGWIARLPPAVDYAEPVSIHLGRLAEALSSIDGIKSIVSLQEASGYGPNAWNWKTEKINSYPQLWGADPVSGLLASVKLISAGGQYVTASKADIAAKLAPAPLLENTPVVMPYGRVRDVAQYHPLSDKIPPCYGLLQQSAVTSEQLRTYRFLLPFEQMMANGCRQLAMLPQLLSFDRTHDAVWGAQWPYAVNSVGNRVHARYAARLKNHVQNRSRDYAQELAIVGYLLEYFGAQRAARMLDTSADEFLKVEQHYLREIAEIGYQRSNLRVDRVSALQKRIAARLGFGSNLFGNASDLSKLPFYLIEHRALLPVKPAAQYDTASQPANLTLSDDLGAVIVALPGTQKVSDLRRGQLIDFVLQGGLGLASDTTTYTLRALIVEQIDHEKNSFWIRIKDNSQLQVHLDQVFNAHRANKLSWKNCQIWLEDLSYPMRYSDTKVKDGGIVLSIPSQQPFPALLQPGDELLVHAIDNPAGADGKWSLSVTVREIDVIAATLTVNKVAGEKYDFPVAAELANYFWTPQLRADRFSFVVSLVMNKAILPPGCNFGTTESWIKKCVQAEVPAHVAVVIHWLGDVSVGPANQMSFQNFASAYSVWQNAKAVQSTSTYQLLRMLSIGSLPAADTGIGSMIVATAEQRAAITGPDGKQWNTDAIAKDSLLFVPATYTPAG